MLPCPGVWCTDVDWSTFALLPTQLLDVFFFGSKVDYYTPEGEQVSGVINKRLGGGLHSDPTWRISSWVEGGKIPDFTALQLREILSFSNVVYKKANTKLRHINQSKKKSRDKKDSQDLIDKSEEWSSYRFNEYNLHKKKMALTRTQLKDVEFDEKMIHLSTGVFEADAQLEVATKEEEKKSIQNQQNDSNDDKDDEIEMVRKLLLPKDNNRNTKIFDYIELKPIASVMRTKSTKLKLRCKAINERSQRNRRSDIFSEEKKQKDTSSTRPRRKNIKYGSLNEDYLSSISQDDLSKSKDENLNNEKVSYLSRRPKRKRGRIDYLNENFLLSIDQNML